MGCNCSKAEVPAAPVPQPTAVASVPVPAVEAPVERAPVQHLPMIEDIVKPVITEMKPATSKTNETLVKESSNISASKKKRLAQKKAKGISPQVVPAVIHESELVESAEKPVNQSTEQAYFSADSEAPKKTGQNAGKNRHVAKKNHAQPHKNASTHSN